MKPKYLSKSQVMEPGPSEVPYWLDQAGAPAPLPPLTGTDSAELAVIGGGFSGLWTAPVERA